MRRAGGLFERIVAWPNLVDAARRARAGKRGRDNVQRFEDDREAELLALQRALRSGHWRPGVYRTFRVSRPVPRLISAAPYRDRVVHHALMNLLGPVLERGMIADSYANRPGKGTHAALDRFTAHARRYRYLLKCDVAQFFPSIDHELLIGLLERRVKCRPTLALAAVIVRGSNPQEPAERYFPGDDLFTPCERRKGLPIGNLTSQWLANLYLDPLDHFVTEQLRPGGYVRYVDDFVLFGDDKGALHEARERIERFLERLRLALHPAKTFVAPTARGCRFLGFVVRPHLRRLRAENVRAMRRRLRDWGDLERLEGDRRAAAKRSIDAWVAHAEHGSTFRLRRAMLGRFAEGMAA